MAFKNPFQMVGELAGDVVGGVGEGLGLIPDQGPMEELQRRYEQNMAAMQAYRPNLANAQAQGLRHTLGAYGPSNEMLKMMYGPQAGLDLQQLGNISPVLANLLAPIQPGAAPPPPAPVRPPGSSTPFAGGGPGTRLDGRRSGWAAGARPHD